MSRLTFAAFALLLAAASLLVSCRRAEESAPTGTDSIVIGVSLPLTGDGAAYGQDIKKGVDLALEEINDSGGVNGRPIRLIYEDDRGEPATAVSAFQKLVSTHDIPAAIAGAFSSPALAVAPIANREQVVVLSPTASSPDLTDAGPFFFRNYPSDTLEGNVMAEIAVDDLRFKRFAILYSTSAYGVGLREVFSREVKARGAEVVIAEGFKEGDTDFRTQLDKVRAANPDAIYMVGYYKEFAKILKQAKELGIDKRILSCVTFNEPELLELAGSAADGVVFAQPYFDPESDDPSVQQFIEAYKKKYASTGGVYAAHGYDALKLLALAMEREGVTGPQIATGLRQIDAYEGASGMTTFDHNGDVVKPFRLFTVKAGQYVLYRQ